MNGQAVIAEVRRKLPIPHHEVGQHFDLDSLRDHLRQADLEFSRHPRKRFVRSTITTRKGTRAPALYYLTTLRVVLAVKLNGEWRQAACL
jgi:hypothetical protein